MERATVKTYTDQCNALDLSGAADCIEGLAADFDRLRPLADEVQAARHVMREHNRLLVELAASQAREEQLRSVLQRIAEQAGGCYAEWAAVALALPHDTSALEAIVARAGEVLRERCAKHIESQYDFSKPMAAAIRALPGVKLEDLQK